MRYIKYTDKNNVRTYHYKYSDLKDFLKRGFEHGDCGFILISKNLLTDAILHRGFGTIEAPCTSIRKLTFFYNEKYDGKIEDALTKEKSPVESYRLTFLNFNN